jgi:hypothetical protein
MHSNRARKLLVALLLLGGVTLVGMGVACTPLQSSPAIPPPPVEQLPAVAPAPLETQPAITPTHPYTPTLQFLAAAGGEGGDILANQGYVYVGDGVQLSVFDVANPAAPQRVRRMGLRGAICQMEMVDDRLYVATRFGGLHIYDLSDPAHPRLLGTAAEGHTPCPFTVVDGMAYAYEWFNVWAIDVSNPAAPFLRDSVDLERGIASPDSIFAVGNTVFARNSVVNASDPDQLQLTHTITGTWVAVVDELAVADGVECLKAGCWGGLVFYDITDPANPQPIGGYPLGQETEFAQVDGDLLVSSTSYQTILLDIDQPNAPVYLSTISGKAFEKNGDLLYISRDTYEADPSGRNGIDVMDISEPTQSELVGSYATPNYIRGYARSGEMVFLRTVVPYGNYHELQIIDVTYPADPYLTGRSYSLDLFSVTETLVQGERAYVLSNMFHVVDYRNASASQILGSYSVSNLSLYDLNVVDEYAYLSGQGQIKILDVHDPTQPTLAQTYGGDPVWASPAQILDNRMGYVAMYDEVTYGYNLQVMQFDPPAPPTVYSIYDGPIEDEIYALDGDEQRVYLTYWNGVVELVDTSNPFSPTLTGTYSSTLHAYLLRQAGDLLLMGTSEKVAIVDFSNPLSPTLASTLEMPTSIYYIQVDGDWAYIATSDYELPENGVTVYDIHDPYNPTLLGTYPGLARHIQIDAGLMYLSADDDGLQVVSLWQPSVFLPQVLRGSP